MHKVGDFCLLTTYKKNGIINSLCRYGVLSMKIENGVFTGTFDELLEYVFSKYGDEIIKAMNEETDRRIADVELPPDWEERSKVVWERICETIKKMEQENA